MNYDRHLNVRWAMQIASEYYDAEAFAHAKRVYEYVKCNEFIPIRYRLDCMCLALMHDLLEDTDYTYDLTFENFVSFDTSEFLNALLLLTIPEDMDYLTYIKRFKESSDKVHQCAWWVKLADMKDHLSQTDTLTDRLRDKYLAALPYLL